MEAKDRFKEKVQELLDILDSPYPISTLREKMNLALRSAEARGREMGIEESAKVVRNSKVQDPDIYDELYTNEHLIALEKEVLALKKEGAE